jgi:hypothetical protein
MPIEVAQIFVSSTWLDLQPERQAVEAALQRLREVKFNGMEYFGSRTETTRGASLVEVDRSHVYVGLFAGRYGSGITEDEYRRARELKLPCLIYFKREAVISAEWREAAPEQAAKLAALKDDLRRNHIVTEFSSPEELAAKITADMHRWLVDQYLTPRLEQAAQGRLPRAQAQELLAAIKDESGLNTELLAAAHKVVSASGAGSVAIGGSVREANIVTGIGNVSGGRADGDLVYGDKHETVINKAPLPVAFIVIAAALLIALGAYVYFNWGDKGGIYRVRATVISPQGVPVENAYVWSLVGGEAKRVAGGWEFNIPAAIKPQDGKVTLVAEQKDAYLKGQTELTLDKDFNPTVIIRLARDTSATVHGQVTDSKGRAVAGAQVFIPGHESEKVITKEGGNFALPAHAAVDQPVQVVAEKAGVGNARLWHPAGNTPVQLVLQR